MANYNTLKTAIQQVVKTNGNNEITGALLQQSLLAMIDSLGVGFQFMGIATPETNPGTPDQNVFYLASNAGTYSNFGSIVLGDGEVAILKYNGTWTKETSGFASAENLDVLRKEVFGANFQIVLGKYIKPDGTIGTSAVGFYTVPYLLKQGETIKYNIRGHTCAILSLYSNGTFTPVVVASGAQEYTNQSYTAANDVWVVFSGTPNTLEAYISQSRIDNNENAIEERTLSDKQMTGGTIINGQVTTGGKWTLSNVYQSVIYPIVTGNKYVVKGGNLGGYIAILSSTTVPTQTGQTVDFSKFVGGEARIVINPNEEYEFVAPVDAAGLWVRLKYQSGVDSCVAYQKIPVNHYLDENVAEIDGRLDALENTQPFYPITVYVKETGKAINDSGQVVTASSFGISEPVYITAGTRVKVTTYGFLLGALSKYDPTLGTYTPIIAYGNDHISTERTSEATIAESGYYVISSNLSYGTWKLQVSEYQNDFKNKIVLTAGAFKGSTGELYNGTGDAIFKNFVAEKLIAVNPTDIILQITGLLTGENYYFAQYDAGFNYLGYVTNTIPQLNANCRYLRVALSKADAYGCKIREVTITIHGSEPQKLVCNSIPSNSASKWQFVVYEVKNAPNVEYPATPTTDFVGESERIYSKGYIVLPDNYDPFGKPVPVILNCHGTNQLTFGSVTLNYNIPYIEFLAKCGFAVIGCYSQTSKYSTERDTNLPSSITMSAYQSLWDYMTKMFNLDKTGAYVFGYSAGGAETILLSSLKTIPIKCAASLAGTMDALCNMRLFWNVNEMQGVFERFGIPWDESIPTYLSTSGRLKACDQSVREYMMAHLDKIKPYNAITFNSDIDSNAFELRFMSVDADTPTLEADTQLNEIVNASRIFLNTPVKIWHAIDDTNVPIQPSRWFAKMVMKGGGMCFMREFPTGCGAHYAVGNTDHLDVGTPMMDYVTPFGETINVPVAYAEMVDWFMKWK